MALSVLLLDAFALVYNFLSSFTFSSAGGASVFLSVFSFLSLASVALDLSSLLTSSVILFILSSLAPFYVLVEFLDPFSDLEAFLSALL